MDKNQQNLEKESAALAAVELVKDGDIVGLGTGTTATFAIKALAKKVKNGLNISAAASSLKTEELAKAAGISILPLENLGNIDISIDGADEFTQSLDLIKGGGGALFREKVIASLSKNAIIIADSSKKVNLLGAFKVPIEVVPLAYQYVFNKIEDLGGTAQLRSSANQKFITDNGNYIIDADFGLITNPGKLSSHLNQIDGLLAHGLFIGLTAKVIMAKGNEIITFS